MKSAITYTLALIVLLILVSFSTLQQKKRKTFMDTNFESGDIIKTPKMAYRLQGGLGVSYKYLDSLEVVANFMISHPKLYFEVGIHTDTRGKTAPNLVASQVRAETIAIQLQSFQVDNSTFKVKGYGESEPLIADSIIRKESTWEEMNKLYLLNSRVELKVLRVK